MFGRLLPVDAAIMHCLALDRPIGIPAALPLLALPRDGNRNLHGWMIQSYSIDSESPCKLVEWPRQGLCVLMCQRFAVDATLDRGNH